MVDDEKKTETLQKGFVEDLDAFFDLYWISLSVRTNYTGVIDSVIPKKNNNKCKKCIIDRQKELLQNPHQFFFIAEDNGRIIGMTTDLLGNKTRQWCTK